MSDNTVPDLTFNWRMTSLFITIVFIFIINGGRDTLLTCLLFTYLTTLGWPATTGTLLLTLYHVTRVVVHIAVVFIAKRVSPTRRPITIANQLILIASAGFMLATVRQSPFLLAIGIIFTGFATSNINPTAITLAQESFKVNSKIMGMLFAGIGSGSIIFSPIAGILMESVGPFSFPVLLFAMSCVTSVLFVMWILLARSVKNMNSMQYQNIDEITVDDHT